MLKNKCEKIIEQMKEYYSSEIVQNILKKDLKYVGKDLINLNFKNEYRQPKTGNTYFSLFILNKVLYKIVFK